MDTTGWHQLGTVTTINTLQYGTNNTLRNNKHLENEHKVARANQAGCFCVSLCSPAAAVAFNRAKALLVVCFVGPSMTKCVFSYHPPLLLLCLDGIDFALILVFCFRSRVCVCDFVSDLAAPKHDYVCSVIILPFSSVWTELILLSFLCYFVLLFVFMFYILICWRVCSFCSHCVCQDAGLHGACP